MLVAVKKYWQFLLQCAAPLLFALPILYGCSSDVIIDKKFVDLFIEMRLAEIAYGKDSPTARIVRQEALKNAGYTREQFLEETDIILANEYMWLPFQKAVTTRLDSMLAKNSTQDTENLQPSKGGI